MLTVTLMMTLMVTQTLTVAVAVVERCRYLHRVGYGTLMLTVTVMVAVVERCGHLHRVGQVTVTLTLTVTRFRRVVAPYFSLRCRPRQLRLMLR